MSYKSTAKEKLGSSELIFTTTVITVLISVFAHGLSAYPGANWYASRMSGREEMHDQMPEMQPVQEMSVRLPWRQ